MVPALSPETVPSEFTVATATLLLVHEPPETEFESVVENPSQTELAPEIAAGNVFTAIACIA